MTARPPLAFSLRLWLFVLSLGALLPALAFGFYATLDAHRQMRQQVLQNLDAKTQHVARLADEQLTRAVVVLNTLGASDAAQNSHWSALYQDAQRTVEATPWIRAITLVNAQGQLLFLSSRPYGEPLFPAHQPELVGEAITTRKPNVSGPFVTPISPHTLVAVTVPLPGRQAPSHVLRAIITTDNINHLLDNSGLPLGWVAGVVDRQGITLARTHSAEIYIGKPATASFTESIRRRDNGPVEGISLEGIRATRMIRPIFGGDWYVGIAVPTADLNEPLTQTVYKLTLIGLVWTGVAFALSQWLGRYLSRQAQALARAVTATDAHATEFTAVREFNLLIARVQAVKHQQAETSGHLHDALEARDEAVDLYNKAPCGYHSLDAEGRVLQINDTELQWLGYPREAVVGQPYRRFMSATGQVAFDSHFPKFLEHGHISDVELEVLRPDGSTRLFLLNATAVQGAGGTHLTSRSTVFDITDRKKLEAQLAQLAHIDPLTGLCNRRDFYDKAQNELARVNRLNTPLSALAIDLDHFKRINDTHGHDGGDLVLQAFSQLLRAALRDIDIIARFGGEEFVVLLPNTTLQAALQTAERLRAQVNSTPVARDDGTQIAYTASIGVAERIPDDRTIDALLKRADQAVYTAKRTGRNRVST